MAGKDPFGLDDDENDVTPEPAPPEQEEASSPDLDQTIIGPAKTSPPAPPPASESPPAPEPAPPAPEPAPPSEPPKVPPPVPAEPPKAVVEEPAAVATDTVRLDLSGPDSLSFGRVDVDLMHGNLIVAAGARLLRLAALLSESPGEVPDLAAVRFAAEESLFVFDEEAQQFTLAEQEAEPARFVLAALIDDLVLSGRWPDKDKWRDRLLVGEGLDREAASARFFELVDTMEQTGVNSRLRELLYIALALGYSGSLRTDPRGPLLLNQHRARLLGRIRDRAARGERPGAVSYAGGATGRSLALVNPVTMAAAGILLVVGALALAVWVYGGGTASDQGADVAVETPSLLQPVADQLASRAKTAIQTDIASGAVQVAETETSILFSVPASTLFQPGSSELDTASAGTVRRLGAALSQGDGPVDLIAMAGGGVAFGAAADQARQLAKARAEEVREHLSSWISDQSRLNSWGIGPLPETIDAGAGNADFPDKMVIVLQKNVRSDALTAQRYLQPAWF